MREYHCESTRQLSYIYEPEGSSNSLMEAETKFLQAFYSKLCVFRIMCYFYIADLPSVHKKELLMTYQK